jgi:hypothetical protein
MTNASLYMSLDEHRNALRDAGFSAHEVRHERGMVMYRAQVERPWAAPSSKSHRH